MDGKTQKVDGEKIVTDYEPVTRDLDRKFTWQDSDGLTPREPLVLKVRAVEDEAPRIVARRDSLEEVVLDSEVVTFDLTATDDFGVKRDGPGMDGIAHAGRRQDAGAAARRSRAGGRAGEEGTRGARARSARRATGVAPQTVEVRAWVDDYLPGRPHVHSAAFILHVLNKTDHALWLTEQFGKWLEAAKESYEREQQLNETNKELRALSAADLDRPENRRRVSQQAAAENANASRLDGLTQSGRNLVEQATKNDEFDAKRLESWATMLKSLKDIAANRMPSVSDLLKQTAGAPAGASCAQPGSFRTQPKAPPPQTPPAVSPGAPNVSHGGTLPGAPKPAPPIDPNAPPKPAAPSIADREPGFSKPGEAQAGRSRTRRRKPRAAGKLRLPVTTLGPAPTKKGDDAPPAAASPAQQKMDDAVMSKRICWRNSPKSPTSSATSSPASRRAPS